MGMVDGDGRKIDDVSVIKIGNYFFRLSTVGVNCYVFLADIATALSVGDEIMNHLTKDITVSLFFSRYADDVVVQKVVSYSDFILLLLKSNRHLLEMVNKQTESA